MSACGIRPKSRVLRAVVGAALVSAAIAAVAVGLYREADRARRAETADSRLADPAVSRAVVVYYFHGDLRCDTCRDIESRTSRLVKANFADEIASDRLRFAVVNFDAPADRHFRDDFDLAFGAVVVQAAGHPDSWENLSDVWTLIHDEPAAFDEYLNRHIRAALEKAG